MTSQLQVLIDSDAFVGQFYTEDGHHRESSRLFQKLQDQAIPVATTNLVILETATVLSHRNNQALAKHFLDVIERSQLPVLHVDEQLYQQSLEIFIAQKERGTSGVDCANVAVMYHYHIPHIFSYDHFYRRQPKIEYF